jgi:hypothetical protein
LNLLIKSADFEKFLQATSRSVQTVRIANADSLKVHVDVSSVDDYMRSLQKSAQYRKIVLESILPPTEDDPALLGVEEKLRGIAHLTSMVHPDYFERFSDRPPNHAKLNGNGHVEDESDSSTMPSRESLALGKPSIYHKQC